MKLKSVLSLLLCCLLTFTPAFAQSESDGMQQALTHAKSKLTIPEEYTEFTYRSQTDSDGMVYWTFIWSAENKGDVQIIISEDGELISYYAWIYTESYDNSLSQYTHAEAREIAKEFIRQVNPEIYPYLVEETPDGEQRNSRSASFSFREYRDTIPTFSNTVSVTVDKYLGYVRNYHSAKRIEGFPNPTAQITEEDAKTAYLSDVGIQMEYRMYYNYRDKEYTVFPVYYLKDTSGKAIDAITDEVIEPCYPESYMFYHYNDTMADGALKEEAAAGVQFTPAELEALATVGEVYSQEDALQIAVDKIPALADYTLRSASLQKDSRDESQLIWYLNLQTADKSFSADVRMNAKTGQLLGFWLPQYDVENTSFTEADAKKIAEAFLLKEASDVFSKTEYTNQPTHYSSAAKEGSLPASYNFTYQRMENGIPVSGNYLSVRVDANTKQVAAYTRSFADNLTFPDISSAMSEEEMMKVMDEAMKFTLVYLPTGEGHRPAYTFLYPSSQLFDAYSGAILGYNGTPVTQTFIPAYTDISGHWAEDMILTLLDNGYYLSENQFRPDDVMTKQEFLELFGMIWDDNDDEIKRVIADIEGISQEEANPDAVMTKEELSQYFIYSLGYGKIAEQDDIFLYPFSDISDVTPSLMGDITILTGLGVFRGNPDGCFYPTKPLTRAEAASSIYYFLQNAQ